MNRIHFLTLILVIVMTSCNNEIQITESVSPIIGTDLPETGYANQEIQITVDHIVYNGCGYYSSHKTEESGNTRWVTFYARYREGVCSMNIPTLHTTYSFTPSAKGTYVFKFYRGETDYLTQTIIII